MRFCVAFAPGWVLLLLVSIWILVDITKSNPSWAIFGWMAFLIYFPIPIIALLIGAGLTTAFVKETRGCFWRGSIIGLLISAGFCGLYIATR